MPRRSDIPVAFDAAMKRDSAGRYTVTVRDFIHQLTAVNHHFSPSQANAWIRQYKISWRLYEEGEHGFNIYSRYNPN